MTLIEATKHAEEVGAGNCACATEHVQLAAWLRELRTARVKLELADDIIADMSDYQCDRSEENDSGPCPEIRDDDDELMFPESEDWCPFCRARDWKGTD